MLLHAAPCALGCSDHLWTVSSYPEWSWLISLSILIGPQRYIFRTGHDFFHVSLKLELDWAAHLRQRRWCSICFIIEKKMEKYSLLWFCKYDESICIYICQDEKYIITKMTSFTNVLFIYGDIDSTLTVSFRMWRSLGIQGIRLTTSQWDFSTGNVDFTIDLSLGILGIPMW